MSLSDSDNSDVDYEPMESDNETIDSYESDDVDISEHEDDGVMLSDSWKRISDIFSDCRPNSLPELVRNFSGVNPALNCNANNSVLDCFKKFITNDVIVLVVLSCDRIARSAGATQKILSETIIEEKESLSEYLKSKVGDTDKDCFQFVENLYSRLESLNNVYSDMKTYQSVFDMSSEIEPPSHKPILQKLIQDIFDPEKPELIDVEYKSGGLGTMLKSGFSLFVNVSKPRPNDNPLLLIYVIGGITAGEARQIKEIVKTSNSNVNVSQFLKLVKEDPQFPIVIYALLLRAIGSKRLQ
ncbi:Sec1 family domain-containing protein 2 [Nymphon striatum]|nr:Sec1 family domain-containing protein 2 [Nymphon striatum]